LEWHRAVTEEAYQITPHFAALSHQPRLHDQGRMQLFYERTNDAFELNARDLEGFDPGHRDAIQRDELTRK
jgi:hypothetical protein